MKIVIVNTSVGNVRSVANMLKKVKRDDAFHASISAEAEELADADAIILPGVGSFDAAMAQLVKRELVDVLNEKAIDHGIPVLGVCLGMQIMAEGSEEGELAGLGWFPGMLKRMQPLDDNGDRIRIPHMGWNIIREAENCILYDNMGEEVRFYFDHAYALQPDNPAIYCGKAHHGITFAAGIRRENIFGVQFHPEKSHRFGLGLFQNFVDFVGHCELRPLRALS